MADNLVDQNRIARDAFALAGLQASQTTRDLFRQYGYTMADGSGNYTTSAAASAWDPQKILQGQGGGALQEGSTGALADIRMAGSESEMLAAEQAMQAGLTGGLAAQRRQVAEYKTGAAANQAKQEFERTLANVQSGYLGDYTTMTNTIQANIQSAADKTAEAYATNPTSVERQFGYGKPGGNPPKNPKKNAQYKGPGGVNWVYDGKGWKKKVG
jgi:hypothetical protein